MKDNAEGVRESLVAISMPIEVSHVWIVYVHTGHGDDHRQRVYKVCFTEASAYAVLQRYEDALKEAGIYEGGPSKDRKASWVRFTISSEIAPRGRSWPERKNFHRAERKALEERFGEMDSNGQWCTMSGPHEAEP